MPTKNPKINVALEKKLYRTVSDLARRQGMSMSALTRDLLREALELREDLALAGFAEARDRTAIDDELLNHEDAWR